MAAALRELGITGGLRVIDTTLNVKAEDRSITDLLEQAELLPYAVVQRDRRSVLYALLDLMESTVCTYDLLLVNLARTWATTGFATLLAERLLRPGGWVVLAGVNFSYARSAENETAWSRTLSTEEREDAQVNRVFEHLLLRNSAFSACRRSEDFFFAQRAGSEAASGGVPERTAAKELLCTVLFDAQFDPDLRFELLLTPEAALRERFPSYPGALDAFHFVSSNGSVCPGREIDANGFIQLTRPAWHKPVTRADLQKFLLRPPAR